MTKLDIEAVKERLKASLEDNRDEEGLVRMDVDDLMDAMSHPKAAGVVESLLALELNIVQQGELAPDFTLPWLSGQSPDGSASLTLSSHFGKRPVALIFGSYT